MIPAVDGFDGEPAFTLRWETERDDVRELVAWNLRHVQRLRWLRMGYGLVGNRGAAQARLPWSEFRGLTETPGLLLLTTGVESGLAIPKRGFADPAAVPRLRDYLAARVPSPSTHAAPSAWRRRR
jgi:YcxB-like protein